jgi:hypothetical protein
MTQEHWQSLSQAQREAIRDMSHLTEQLKQWEGWRVEVVTVDGETKRFNVGRSTGWRPIHLEVYNSRSMGGMAADKQYRSVKAIRRVN